MLALCLMHEQNRSIDELHTIALTQADCDSRATWNVTTLGFPVFNPDRCDHEQLIHQQRLKSASRLLLLCHHVPV